MAERRTAVTVGTFDGVHRGHRDVLERLGARARETGLDALVISFDPHPLEVVRPAAAPLLLTPGAERLTAMADTGIGRMAVLPFTPALAALSATAFVEQILIGRFGMRQLLIGHDHGFGRDRAGDVEVLQSLGRERGFGVEVVPAVTCADGSPVSSTLVRRAISEGDLALAQAALGRRYAVHGEVVAGDGRGRALGFRTLNLSLPSPRKLLPPVGVYAVVAETRRERFGGMMNLGPRPTFGDGRISLEAHLFDADGDYYGEHVRVEFVERLRDVTKFPSPAALIEQLSRDATAARLALTQLL